LGKLARDQLVAVVDDVNTAAECREMAAVASTNGWEFLPLPDNRGFGAGCKPGVTHTADLGCPCFLRVTPGPVVRAELASALRVHRLRQPNVLITPCIDYSARTLTPTVRCSAAGLAIEVRSLVRPREAGGSASGP
jgi:hypothetical protein